MFDKRACYDRDNEFSQSFVGENDINMNVDVNMQGPVMGNASIGGNNAMQPAMQPVMAAAPMQGSVSQPIIEPMQERVINRTIMHEVPHVCPKRTKIVNHHVYRHTYRPSYSCCEENTCSTINCGSCCGF